MNYGSLGVDEKQIYTVENIHTLEKNLLNVDHAELLDIVLEISVRSTIF